jgi:Flp pilus assembly protein TadG
MMLRGLLPRQTSTARDERGAAMVLVAVALPVLVLFMAFGIEVGHWFDYSRNLQNRADAAATAAAVAYGATCFGSATTAQADVIGKVAQQYAGPPNGDTTAGNLPYPITSIPAANYKNQPNLTKGAPTDFHMLLNSTQSYPNAAAANWNMGTAGHTDSTALCSSRDEDGNIGAMVDVRLTQANLGLFFPLFGFRPTISAHARAALQGESSTIAAPIAVGDSGQIPCVSVRLVNATTNALIQTVTLAKAPANPLTPGAPVQWDNTATPASFTMPASDNVYVQPFLSDCNGTGQIYDDGPSGAGLPGPTGLLMINNHPATNPTVANGAAPQLNAAGVTASGTCTNATQYFSVGGCTISVNAGVTFAGNVGNGGQNVFVRLRTWNPATGAWVLGAQASLHRPGTSGCPATAWCGDPTIADQSGVSELVIDWSQTSDSITGLGSCNNQSSNPCTGTFGIQAEAFGACNGCNQPDDSGPIVFSRISEADNAGVIIGNDTNSFATGSTHKLVFTFKLSGLNTAAPADPPTVLRFANSTNHQTGLIDCGQGNGGGNDSAVVYYGCGPDNPQVPGMNPLFIYSRPPGSDCSPATNGNTTGWPNGNQQDCVQTTPGQRRQNIICPLVDRIVNSPYGTNCNNQATGTCPANNWSTTTGSQNILPGDPRAVQMIVTSTADFASGVGSPQAWLPIRKFATFYITGWDNNIKPQCAGNEAYPGKNKNNSDNGAVWGHWINYEDTSGTPNGQLCAAGATPTNCVPALTR